MRVARAPLSQRAVPAPESVEPPTSLAARFVADVEVDFLAWPAPDSVAV